MRVFCSFSMLKTEITEHEVVGIVKRIKNINAINKSKWKGGECTVIIERIKYFCCCLWNRTVLCRLSTKIVRY